MHKGRELLISGLVFLFIALVLPTHDQFQFSLGGRQKTITRLQQPLLYWGGEGVVLFISVALMAAGIYRWRQPRPQEP